MKDINLIWPVILFLLGLFMLINPKLLWKMEHYLPRKMENQRIYILHLCE